MEKKFTLLLLAFLAMAFTMRAAQPPAVQSMETPTWKVTLLEIGSSKTSVIQVVRNHTGLGLMEAKRLVESAPCVVLENSMYEPAKSFYDDLIAAGATAELTDTDPGGATNLGWCVDLLAVGNSTAAVIGVLRNELGLGLMEARELLNSLPVNLLYNVSRAPAQSLYDKLVNVGAQASMYQLSMTLTAPTDLNVSDILGTKATVGWQKGGTENKWMIRYGIPEFSGGFVNLTFDFEDNTLQGLTRIDGDGDHFSVDAVNSTPHGGDHGLISWWGDVTTDNWAVLPKVPLGGELRFWAYLGGSEDEAVTVWVSTTGNTNPADFTQVSEAMVPSAPKTYEEFVVDLSAYAGQEGYIAIRHTDPEKFSAFFDDITYSLESSFTVDNWMSARDITQTSTQISGLNPETTYAVQVCATQDDNISPWTDAELFTTKTILPPHDLKAIVQSQTAARLEWEPGGEEDYSIVRCWKDETLYDFERRITSDWTLTDADGDSYNWRQYDDNDVPHSGIAYMYSWGRTGVDNWLILPKRELGGLFTVWARCYYYSSKSKFAIYVSTTGKNPEDFTQVSDVIVADDVYRNYFVMLNAYDGQEGYVAIRHFDCETTLVVDDIGVIPADQIKAFQTDMQQATFSTLEADTPYCATVQGIAADNSFKTPWADVISFRTMGDVVFMTDGNWNNPACWYNNRVPPAGSNVTINANVTIPAGYLADVNTLTVAENGRVIVADGGQLKLVSSNSDKFVMQKQIQANKYYYVGWPMSNGGRIPDEMLEGNYTLETFNQGKGWQRASFNSTLRGFQAYRYSNDHALTIEVEGQPYFNYTRSYSLSYNSSASTWQGYNFVANPFPSECYVTEDYAGTTARPYWLMNARGELEPASGPIAPLQGFFVKASDSNDILYCTTKVPQYTDPIQTPENLTATVDRNTAKLSWTGHDEHRWNIRYREADNGTWQYWDFEDGTMQGWTSLDADGDGYGWNWSLSYYYSHGGDCLLFSKSYTGTDDYLISPKLTLGGVFSMWVRGSSNKEHFTVYYSKNNWNTAQFSQASQEYVHGTSAYRQYSIDLSDMDATGQGYIIVRHHNSTKGNNLCIDDISYLLYPETGYVEAGEWQSKGVHSNPFRLTGLKEHTKYDVQVQGIFAGEGRVSDWSDIVQFTTAGGQPTGIVDAQQVSDNDEWYSVDGQKLNQRPTKRGLYIHNGQKVVVR